MNTYSTDAQDTKLDRMLYPDGETCELLGGISRTKLWELKRGGEVDAVRIPEAWGPLSKTLGRFNFSVVESAEDQSRAMFGSDLRHGF